MLPFRPGVRAGPKQIPMRATAHPGFATLKVQLLPLPRSCLRNVDSAALSRADFGCCGSSSREIRRIPTLALWTVAHP
jgi:hypothetical protein